MWRLISGRPIPACRNDRFKQNENCSHLSGLLLLAQTLVIEIGQAD